MAQPGFKTLTNFLVDLGIEAVPHSQKSYLAHLIAVYRFMEAQGCEEELCRAGMFHSIYGTEKFQGFKLELDQREKVRELIGTRAEKLGYLNCAMDRASLDRVVETDTPPHRIIDRLTSQEVELSREELDDLCRVHLYDWLEQVPRSRYGWNYRRAEYRRMAERLGSVAVAAYDRVFALEPTTV